MSAIRGFKSQKNNRMIIAHYKLPNAHRTGCQWKKLPSQNSAAKPLATNLTCESPQPCALSKFFVHDLETGLTREPASSPRCSEKPFDDLLSCDPERCGLRNSAKCSCVLVKPPSPYTGWGDGLRSVHSARDERFREALLQSESRSFDTVGQSGLSRSCSCCAVKRTRSVACARARLLEASGSTAAVRG